MVSVCGQINRFVFSGTFAVDVEDLVTIITYVITFIFILWADLNSSGWAKGWVSRDFELLCADGQRASLTEWKNCNLGAIPPNIVMTRPVLAARIYDFLMKSQVSSNHFLITSHIILGILPF